MTNILLPLKYIEVIFPPFTVCMVYQEENLSAMNTDPWYSAYHYSHPPLVERLAAIDELEKKED